MLPRLRAIQLSDERPRWDLSGSTVLKYNPRFRIDWGTLSLRCISTYDIIEPDLPAAERLFTPTTRPKILPGRPIELNSD